MKCDVFISYSSTDQKIVEALSHYLEENNIRCFVAYRDIPKGKVWAAAITEAIEECQMMVVVFSEHFNASIQVDREIEMCSEERKPILTYRISNTDFKGAKKYYLKNLNWIDAFPNPKSNFGELLNSICKLIDIKPKQITSSEDSLTTQEDQPKYFNLKIKPDADCAIYVDDEKVADAACDKITRLVLRKGTYSLRFESKLYPLYSKSQIYQTDNAETDYLLAIEIRNEALLAIPDDQLEPYICDGGCGFNYNGTKVLELKYNLAYTFSCGFAQVKLNWKYGFINKAGEEIVPPKYNSVESFSEGLACVTLDGMHGFIDNTGKEITPLKYSCVYSFKGGLAKVGIRNFFLYEKGFIDKSGKEVIPLKYYKISSFAEGLAHIKNGKHGFINKNGEEVIPRKYDSANQFSEGLARVELDGKHGFINTSGEEVIALKYDNADTFSGGLAWVSLNDKYGFINKGGEEIIPLKYDEVYPFSDGLAWVSLNREYGLINKKGEEIIPPKYDDVYPFSEGLAWVRQDSMYGLINKKGEMIIPFKYRYVNRFIDGIALVELNDKWGFIDKDDKEVLAIKYDSLYQFDEGLATVKLNGKSGYIDKQGNIYWE